MPPTFRVGARDRDSRARRGTLLTAHGPVETPAFMPVGTRAAVTGMTPAELRELGAQMILANTYHLLLRPGPELFRSVGGIHRFMRWDGPLLTDSGGFQIFSLPNDRVISEEGARFRSYVDQSEHLLSPERSIEVQEAIGSDVMMVLDVCLPSTSGEEQIREAMERTHRWALRSLAARTDSSRGLFAIVQGGVSPELRRSSADFLTTHPFDGFAIGGLAVGDTRTERQDVIALTAEALPEEKPRYLMGVGTPADILEGIERGVDLFDCVLPTMLAWQTTAFTSTGRVRLDRTEYRTSDAPLDAACRCSVCTTFTRGYLHHLVKCREPMAPRLLSFHNLHHYLSLAEQARGAIEQGRFAAFARETLACIDRREHSEGVPGRKARYELVTVKSGAASVRDVMSGEVMHPVVGAVAEAEDLYARQTLLAARLERGPVTVFDVGLGAASNALAARRIAERLGPLRGGPRLTIVSFERDLGPLQLAIASAAQLGIDDESREACRLLAETGEATSAATRWLLIRGELPQTLREAPLPADVVFWDPYSPRTNPGLWTIGAFSLLRARCAPRAVLVTYSSSTTTRVALASAGFAVGLGAGTGAQGQTTCAALEVEDLGRPLGPAFLDKLARSTAPMPADAPRDVVARLRASPQFAQAQPASALQHGFVLTPQSSPPIK